VALKNNVLGNMYALTVLTPIAPGAEESLKAYLEGLPRDDSPLARLPRTHFGRWVIVEELRADPSDRKPDVLGCQYLVFSSTLDGDLSSYLDELCEELATEAEQIWGVCIGAPHPTHGPALKDYLLHNQIHTTLFFSAYPDATVADVRHSLELRNQTLAFAVGAQGLEPAALQHAFREEFGV
jgi:hypothetical protein